MFPINNQKIQIFLNVQNNIQLFVQDIDSKVSFLNGAILNFNIVDFYHGLVLLSKPMVLLDSTQSLYMVSVAASDTIGWLTGSYKYSVTVNNLDGTVTTLFSDMNYQPYNTLEVCQGPLPAPAPALTLYPSDFPILNYMSYSSNLIGSAQIGYPIGSQTFALYMSGYTGALQINGSLQPNPVGTNIADWFNIITPSFTDVTGVSELTITGNYLWLQILIPTYEDTLYPNMPPWVPPVTSGSINMIVYKN